MAGNPLKRMTQQHLAAMETDAEGLEAWWSEVLSQVADGRSLYEICQDNGWAYSVLSMWVRTRPDRESAWEKARQSWAEAKAYECIPIADSLEGSVKMEELQGKLEQIRIAMEANADTEKLSEQVDELSKSMRRDVRRDKLRIETRLTMAARVSPRQWAEHRGGEISERLPTVLNIVIAMEPAKLGEVHVPRETLTLDMPAEKTGAENG